MGCMCMRVCCVCVCVYVCMCVCFQREHAAVFPRCIRHTMLNVCPRVCKSCEVGGEVQETSVNGGIMVAQGEERETEKEALGFPAEAT